MIKNIKKGFLKISLLAFFAIIYPLSVLAQPSGDYGCFSAFQSDKRLGTLFNYVTCTISNTVIPLIFAIAVVIFIWGVVQFILNSDEEAKRAKGKQFMIWGIIALTVMIGMWGLVGILGNTFDISTNALPQIKPN